ncbi:MAG: hypothetical protein H6850_02910 [Alphaproteobacteria bacterium]|nr:MAG: hypothetical protein H6850_02910 [Alphaproteobacteria bacterium]
MFWLFCNNGFDFLLPNDEMILNKLEEAVKEEQKRRKFKKRKVDIKISKNNLHEFHYQGLQHQSIPDPQPIKNKILEE